MFHRNQRACLASILTVTCAAPIAEAQTPWNRVIKGVAITPAPGALPTLPGFEDDDERPARVPGCVGDLNGDGAVGAADLALHLGDWASPGGPADLNGDGVVGAADLALLLGAWGPCR